MFNFIGISDNYIVQKNKLSLFFRRNARNFIRIEINLNKIHNGH